MASPHGRSSFDGGQGGHASFDDAALATAVWRHQDQDPSMQTLIILNDPPYGSERGYNALRLANAITKTDAEGSITVFLMADAVVGAKAGQKTPEGYYTFERMLKRLLSGKGEVLLCSTCMDARGLGDADLMPGARRSSMDELAAAVGKADKVLVF
jgi:uncharacterized protein involved in oxidation of intracellular sulfur